MSSAHIIVDDDVLSLDSDADLSFVARNMENFFGGFESPELGSSSTPQQSPRPFSLSNASPRSSPLMFSLSRTTEASAMESQPARLVSVESMSQVKTGAPSKSSSSSQTPLNSLKKLVSQKKQQQHWASPSIIGNKRPADSVQKQTSGRSGCPLIVASVFGKPSAGLQKILREQEQTCDEPASKKAKVSLHELSSSASFTTRTSPSALHEACRRSDVTVQEINQLLRQDPKAAQRPITLMRQRPTFNPFTKAIQNLQIPETYRYPLNLAIQYKCSAAILEALVIAAPSVLKLRDGHQQHQRLTPLHVLFRHQPTDYAATADMMLLKQPPLAEAVDAKLNTPLHQAVECGINLRTVRHLVLLNPNALLKRNFHGRTPLDLAQHRDLVCNDPVADFLWKEVEKQF